MEKKVYIRPLMTEVKIKNNRLLVGSPNIYNTSSGNRSYSRGGNYDDDYEE